MLFISLPPSTPDSKIDGFAIIFVFLKFNYRCNMLNSNTIRKKLRANIFKTQNIRDAFQDNVRKFSSTAWNSFDAIIDDTNTPLLEYVFCKYCSGVLKHQLGGPKIHGTTNLLRHRRICEPKVVKRTTQRNTFFPNTLYEVYFGLIHI